MSTAGEPMSASGEAASATHVIYRPLAYTDLPQVLSIERRSFSAPWSLGMFLIELSKPSSFCIAAVEGRRLLGYLICSRYHDDWHLMNIAVDPSARRRGIGTGLLEAMLARGGHDAAYTLEVRASNQAAIALYERFGFRSAGVRPRYYADNGEDAIVMWRERPGSRAASAAAR
jgi:ribosomal-protein-alanine N-acetyltransferase